jgi:cell division protein FtsI (penicillin-binding protein 3)
MSAATQGIVRLPVWRARFVMAGLMGAFALLAARSVYLQAMKTDFLQEKGEARYARVLEIPATRGTIFDRNGEALAVSTPVKSIWAIPADARLSEAQRRKLAALLGVERTELNRKLSDTSRDFVYLKRQISPETADAIEALQLDGIHQQREFRRYYPGGEVTAHVVGFAGVDDAGQEGVELAFQDVLGGKPGSRRVIKDRLGRVVEDVQSIRPAHDGAELRLSLDSKLQNLAYSALKSAVEVHRAKAGAIVVLDVRTGEVLALANAPSYNPNSRARLNGAQVRNRVITDAFEPGSTLGLPRETMWDLFRRVGFGATPELGFPGAASGKLRHYRGWRPIEQATMAYGHGISVSLLQLARAYTVFATDGELVPVTLVKSTSVATGEKVLSAETARAVRAMLEMAVQNGGTGPRARVVGWRVAGKTGTAHKQENGGYAADKYLSSFVGFAPASAPRLVVAVMIDEPSAGQYYGGAVAAPVFAQVIQGALRMLGVPHDGPLEPLEIPGEADLREST